MARLLMMLLFKFVSLSDDSLFPGLLYVCGFFAAISCLAAVAVAGPGVVAVRWLTAHRAVGFLVRGSLERTCVTGAALAGALATAMQALLAAGHGEELSSFFLLALAGPGLIGAAPWVAGEILSGPSEKQVRSLLASFAASAVTLWASGFFALTVFGTRGPGTQFAAPLLASVLSCAAYLRTRGGQDAALVLS